MLEARVRAPTTAQRDVLRARIVLLAASGRSTRSIAAEVKAMPRIVSLWHRRRRRVAFLSFMNKIVAAYPGREMHVVLDNLSTHKPKRDQWLKRHRNVHFHFTPTHASWLNQIEVWLSILTAKSLQDASFTSVQQLKDHIDAFIKSYHARAKPFIWTKTRVRQKNLKPRITQT